MKKSNVTVIIGVDEVSVVVNKATKKSKIIVNGQEIEISHDDALALIDSVYCQIDGPPLKMHSAMSYESSKGVLTCICEDCDVEVDIDTNSKGWEKLQREFFEEHPIVAKG